jgi:hypothetical protein
MVETCQMEEKSFKERKGISFPIDLKDIVGRDVLTEKKKELKSAYQKKLNDLKLKIK